MEACQTLHIPAGVGINQADSEELIEPGQWNLNNENVRFAVARGGLGKRPGFTALSSIRLDGSTRSTGYKVLPYGQQVCAIDGHLLDVYQDSTVAAWVTRDRVSEAGVPRRLVLPYPGATALIADSAATSNGIIVAVAAISSGANLQLQASVVDATTGAVLRTEVLSNTMAATGWMSIVTIGTTALIFYVVSGSVNTVFVQTLDCSSRAGIGAGWTVAASIVTNRQDNIPFDTFAFSDRVALAYVNSNGTTNRVSVATVNVLGSLITATSVATSSVVPSVVCCAGLNGDRLYVGWNQTTSNLVIGLDPVLLTITASAASLLTASATQFTIVVTAAGAGTILVTSGAVGSVLMTALDWAVSGGAIGAAIPSRTGTWPNIKSATKPIRVDGRTFVVAAPQSILGGNLQQNLLVVDITDDSTLRPVATVAPRLSLIGAGTQHLSLVAGKQYVFVNAIQRNALSGSSGSNVVGATGPSLEATFVDFGDPTRFQKVEFNGDVYLTGGLTSVFDGQIAREAAFLTRPDAPTTALSGGSITDTSIRYVAVYEGIDASGNVAWSAVSDPSAQISPAAQNVTVTVAQALTTSRYDTANPAPAVRISIYRTASSTGGLTYYRVGFVTQTSNTNTLTYIDSTPSATLITQAQLYKMPGVAGTAQDRFCPPGFGAMVSYNGSIVGVGDDGYSVWYSAQQVLGEEIWWNPVFQFPITDEGPITSLAVMDGTLFVFKRRAIYSATGTAPSDSGAQGGFNAPALVSANAGCREPRSIEVTNIGLFFMSDRGIELLVRGGQSTQWIGEQVRMITAGWPVCTAATLDFTQERVFFELAQSETSNQVGGTGRTLVYNLTVGCWESIDRRLSSTGVADIPAQSACMAWVNQAWHYVWIDTSGVVYFEDQTTNLDSGRWVTARYETPWVKLGLQQRMQVHQGMILFSIAAPCGILIEHANRFGNYDAAFNKVWSDEDVSLAPTRELEFTPMQTNWAFKCRVSDAPPASGVLGTGQGLTWIGLSFDLSPELSDTKNTPNLAPEGRR